MQVSLIVAIGKNRVIGASNALLWHLPADMKHFRQLTMGKPIIMGRKTFESIGKPLSGRTNIVITHESNYQAQGCIVVHSLKEALEAAQGSEEVMVIGGESVYKEFLPMADKMYLTLIHADFEGDTYFPEYNQAEWNEKERQDFKPDKENPYPYSFVVLERRR